MNAKYPDLLFPDEFDRESKILLDRNVIDDLEVGYIAMLICPYNTDMALKVLTELYSDERVALYRQDILEDFMRIPQLEVQLSESLRTINENAHSVFAKAGATQSFFELEKSIADIESFIECMQECHVFFQKYGSKVRSAGLKLVFEELDKQYQSDNFNIVVNEISELKKAIGSEIRSVVFGVNLDNLMRPTQIMLLSISQDELRKKTLFDRLLGSARQAEPISEIYSRKCTDGTIDRVNEVFFSELDKLSSGYMKRFNSAIDHLYRESTSYLIQLAPQIDFYLGVKRFIERVNNLGLNMCRPKLVPLSERKFVCKDMYDPVLANKYVTFTVRDRMEVRIFTNDCSLDDSARILILSGANNGGKTTYTRAAGVNQILAQSGLYVAASSAVISLCSGIFTHFPKKEEIGINTSRFAEECKTFRSTIETADSHSLVLMNESLSSTNPYYSGIIGEELIKIFADIGCRMIFNTHFAELSQKAESINATGYSSTVRSVYAECDKFGKPTYRIIDGLPPVTENAKFIFDKYGISYEKYKAMG